MRLRRREKRKKKEKRKERREQLLVGERDLDFQRESTKREKKKMGGRGLLEVAVRYLSERQENEIRHSGQSLVHRTQTTPINILTVSYTHLTLPTNREV